MSIASQVGGVMTPRYFDCGSNGGASSAFSWDLFVSVVTTATAVTPESTAVATVIATMRRRIRGKLA